MIKRPGRGVRSRRPSERSSTRSSKVRDGSYPAAGWTLVGLVSLMVASLVVINTVELVRRGGRDEDEGIMKEAEELAAERATETVVNELDLRRSFLAGDFKDEASERQIEIVRRLLAASRKKRKGNERKEAPRRDTEEDRRALPDDRAGALETFGFGGITYCRLYAVCRTRNGYLTLPGWMEKVQEDVNSCLFHNSLLRPRSISFSKELESRAAFEMTDEAKLDWFLNDAPPQLIEEMERGSQSFTHRTCREAGGTCSWTSNAVSPVIVDGDFQWTLRSFGDETPVAPSDFRIVYGSKERACFRSLVVAKERDFDGNGKEYPFELDDQNLIDLADGLIARERERIARYNLRQNREEMSSTRSVGRKNPSTADVKSKAGLGQEVKLTEERPNMTFLPSLLVFDVDDLPTAPVCRVVGVRLSSEGILYLPGWMELYDGLLDRCGVAPRRYDKPPLNFATVQEEMGSYDVVGSLPLSPDPDLLLRDILAAGYSLEVLNGLDFAESRRISCFTETSQNRSDCHGIGGSNQLTRLSLLLPNELRKSLEIEWLLGFSKLVKSTETSDPARIFFSDAVPVDSVARFRSLISSHFPQEATALLSSVFVGAGIDRRPREIQPLAKDCRLGILLDEMTSRETDISPSMLAGTIKTLTSAGGNLLLHTNISQVNLSDISFLDQVRWLQESDIFITPHHHGLATLNLIFLRRGSLFLDLVPFGLSDELRSDLTSSLSLRYLRVSTNPDATRYQSCVERSYSTATLEYTQLMSQWTQATNSLSSTKISTQQGWKFLEHELDKVHRRCLREQRLIITTMDLARFVTEEASLICPKRRPRRRR